MFGGYRLVVAAIVGCLGAAFLIGYALQPEQPNLAGDRSYQEQSADYRAGGASCEPSAIRRLADRQRTGKAQTCAESEEQHRQAANSLIEARRSADAADASAIAAFQQTAIAGWGTGLGFVTMIAAIAAAIYARNAATETRRSADATIDGRRPWVKVSLTLNEQLIYSPFTLTVGEDAAGLMGRIVCHNVGDRPAVKLRVWHRLSAYSTHSEAQDFHDDIKAGSEALIRPDWKDYGSTLFPGKKHKIVGGIGIEGLDQTLAQLNDIRFIRFVVVVYYGFEGGHGQTVTGGVITPAETTRPAASATAPLSCNSSHCTNTPKLNRQHRNALITVRTPDDDVDTCPRR